MKLFSFPIFFLLAQTLQVIEGEVQCGNNNAVSSCFYCMFNPEANPPVDSENCDTSPDCMLNTDSSRCVPRPENSSSEDLVPSVIRPVEPPVLPANPAEAPEAPVNNHVLPLDADNSDTNQEVFLSRIKVDLRQPDQQWSDDQFGFEVRVCNERYHCCRSGNELTQIWDEGGSTQSIMFGARFNNLGNCGDIAKDQTLDITVFRTTEGYRPNLMSVTITFEDGSVFRKRAFSRSCNLWQRCETHPQPLLWNNLYSDVPENIPSGNRRPRVEPLPAAQCPDVHNPSANLCPKDNVRVLRTRPQRERKFCYYQK